MVFVFAFSWPVDELFDENDEPDIMDVSFLECSN
jgi:hypothetical protein